MIDYSTTILHGFAICIPFSILAITTFWLQPRLWLHSLPPDIQRMAGPKTTQETKRTRWLMVAVLLLLPGLSIASLLYASQAAATQLTVIGAFVHLYTVWVIVHIWDLLVIDGAHVLLINPESPPIPGTQGAAGYRDFAFHCRAFEKACVMSLLFVVPVAVLMGTLL